MPFDVVILLRKRKIIDVILLFDCFHLRLSGIHVTGNLLRDKLSNTINLFICVNLADPTQCPVRLSNFNIFRRDGKLQHSFVF